MSVFLSIVFCAMIPQTRMHSSRMHTTRSSTVPGGGLRYRDPLPGQRPSWTDTPWTETLLDRHPLDRDPPGQRPPWTKNPQDREPLQHRPPWTEINPVNRITDKCKNITFSQLRLRAVKILCAVKPYSWVITPHFM